MLASSTENNGNARLEAGPVTAFLDCTDMRLGDRMACTWFAQHRHRLSGERFAVIDRHPVLARDFPLPHYFGETYVDWPEQRILDAGLPRWLQGNIWITATNAYDRAPRAGCFETLPASVTELAGKLMADKQSGRPRVLIHVLDDAPYNLARRWKRKDANRLGEELRRQGCEVILLNPSAAQFIGGFDRMLAEMLAADIFVGGDTGPSHVFAMLCADKPQIALYPSMLRDQRNFAAEQKQLGLPLPWNSLPKRPDLRVIEMDCKRSLIWRGWQPLIRRTGSFDGRAVARQVMAALADRSRNHAPTQQAPLPITD